MSGTQTPAPATEPVTWVEKTGRLGAAGVTLIIFAMLAAEMAIAARYDTTGNQTFTNIVEVTKSLAILAAGFWMGSSKSSADKTEALAAAAKAPQPAPVAPAVGA